MGSTFSDEYTPKYKQSDYEHKRPGKNNYIINIDNVYWRGIKVEGSDSKTFIDAKNGYGTDAKFIYYKGRMIGRNVSFKNLFGGYAENSKYVFYQGYIINADPKTFVVIKDGEYIRGRDKNYTFINGTGKLRKSRSR